VPVDIMVVVMAGAGVEWFLQRWWPRDDLADEPSIRRRRPPRRAGEPSGLRPETDAATMLPAEPEVARG
jgi:hypothetical protein